MKIFGEAPASLREELLEVLSTQCESPVLRAAPAKSSVPHPQSTDLEMALCPLLVHRGFQHHVRFAHPRTGDGFEYDFWRPADGVAIEVMGYRADDEIYKDILKFHVHRETRIGVVLVPRYKWISSKRTDTNYTATIKALSFADGNISVKSLIAISYDWESTEYESVWRFAIFDD